MGPRVVELRLHHVCEYLTLSSLSPALCQELNKDVLLSSSHLLLEVVSLQSLSHWCTVDPGRLGDMLPVEGKSLDQAGSAPSISSLPCHAGLWPHLPARVFLPPFTAVTNVKSGGFKSVNSGVTLLGFKCKLHFPGAV